MHIIQLGDARGAEKSLPHGVTVKEDAKSGSLYNRTKAALALPLTAAGTPIQTPQRQTCLMPSFLLHCTLSVRSRIGTPHPVPFREIGCAAIVSRLFWGKKELQVQIPLFYLGSPEFIPYPTASTTHANSFAFAEKLPTRPNTGNVKHRCKASPVRAKQDLMTDLVSRPLVERVISVVCARKRVFKLAAKFSAEAVLEHSDRLTAEDDESGEKAHIEHAGSEDAKEKSLHRNEVQEAMVFVTLDLLAPSHQKPHMGDVLGALERRAVIWVEAGRLLTLDSPKATSAADGIRFLVRALVPERFAKRCEYYRSRNSKQMPSDLDPQQVKQFGYPLIVHRPVERAGRHGVNMQAHLPSPSTLHQVMVKDTAMERYRKVVEESKLPDYKNFQRDMLNGYGMNSKRARCLVDAELDFFEGWSIGVSPEPAEHGF
jgi:hypothetical protein